MQPGQFIQTHRAGRKTLFQVGATMIISLWQWARRDAWILSRRLRVSVSPHAYPVIGLRLFKVDPSLLILQAEKAAAILTVLEALLTAGKTIPIIREGGLKKARTAG